MRRGFSHGRYLLMAGVILFGLSFDSIAETHIKQKLGAGHLSCAFWAALEADNGSAIQLHYWATGYITGYNRWVHKGYGVSQMKPEAIYDWLGAYCKAHPNEKFFKAADALLEKMKTDPPHKW